MNFLHLITYVILAETGEKPTYKLDPWLGTNYWKWSWGSGPDALELSCYAGIPGGRIFLYSPWHAQEACSEADVPLHEICLGDEYLFIEPFREAMASMKEAIAFKAVALIAGSE